MVSGVLTSCWPVSRYNRRWYTTAVVPREYDVPMLKSECSQVRCKGGDTAKTACAPPPDTFVRRVVFIAPLHATAMQLPSYCRNLADRPTARTTTSTRTPTSASTKKCLKTRCVGGEGGGGCYFSSCFSLLLFCHAQAGGRVGDDAFGGVTMPSRRNRHRCLIVNRECQHALRQ